MIMGAPTIPVMNLCVQLTIINIYIIFYFKALSVSEIEIEIRINNILKIFDFFNGFVSRISQLARNTQKLRDPLLF